MTKTQSVSITTLVMGALAWAAVNQETILMYVPAEYTALAAAILVFIAGYTTNSASKHNPDGTPAQQPYIDPKAFATSGDFAMQKQSIQSIAESELARINQAQKNQGEGAVGQAQSSNLGLMRDPNFGERLTPGLQLEPMYDLTHSDEQREKWLAGKKKAEAIDFPTPPKSPTPTE